MQSNNNVLMDLNKNYKKGVKKNVRVFRRFPSQPAPAHAHAPAPAHAHAHAENSSEIVINNGENISINGGNITVNSDMIYIHGKIINIDSSAVDTEKYMLGCTIVNNTKDYNIYVKYIPTSTSSTTLTTKEHVMSKITADSYLIEFTMFKGTDPTNNIYGVAPWNFDKYGPCRATNASVPPTNPTPLFCMNIHTSEPLKQKMKYIDSDNVIQHIVTDKGLKTGGYFNISFDDIILKSTLPPSLKDYDYPINYEIINNTSTYDIVVAWNGNGFSGTLPHNTYSGPLQATTESNTITFNIYKTGTANLYALNSFAYSAGAGSSIAASANIVITDPYSIIEMVITLTSSTGGPQQWTLDQSNPNESGPGIMPANSSLTIQFNETITPPPTPPKPTTLIYNYTIVNTSPYDLSINGSYVANDTMCLSGKSISWASDGLLETDTADEKSNTWVMYWPGTKNIILDSVFNQPNIDYNKQSTGINLNLGTQSSNNTDNPLNLSDIKLFASANVKEAQAVGPWYGNLYSNPPAPSLTDILIPYTDIQALYNFDNYAQLPQTINTFLFFSSERSISPIDISLNITNSTPYIMAFNASSSLPNIPPNTTIPETWHILKSLYDKSTSQITYNFLNGTVPVFPAYIPITYALGTTSPFTINNGIATNIPVTLSGTINGTKMTPDVNGNIIIPDLSSNAVINLTFTAAAPSPYDISFVLINNSSFGISGVSYTPSGSTNLIPNPPVSDSKGNTNWKFKSTTNDANKYSTQWSFYSAASYVGGGSLNYDVVSDYGISGIGHNWSVGAGPTVSITAIDSYGNVTPSPFTRSIVNGGGNQWVPPFPTTTNGNFNFNKGGIITITYTD